MNAEMLIERSPMRAVAASIRGGLEAGQVGGVLARAGVGKSAFLVHVALNSLIRGTDVLHVSLTDGQARVRSFYDEILAELANNAGATTRATADLHIERHRTIHSCRGKDFGPGDLEKLMSTLEDVMHFLPSVVVIDGLDSKALGQSGIDQWRAIAEDRSIRLWLGLRTHRAAGDMGPSDLSPLLDTVVELDPEGADVILRVTKVGGVAPEEIRPLVLDPVTMMVHPDDIHEPSTSPPSPHPSICMLYSGGARGAEAAFGEQAARWGMGEVNFTFDGHKQDRNRGSKLLDEAELAAGDVSMVYVAHRLHRNWDKTEMLKKVLQSQWHIVSNASQVFVIGAIQEDGTVRGGTGWSVELARRWRKPVWVFDQEQGAWHTWNGEAWIVGNPIIHSTAIAGTGTRFLNEAGQQAIAQLFTHSFSS